MSGGAESNDTSAAEFDRLSRQVAQIARGLGEAASRPAYPADAEWRAELRANLQAAAVHAGEVADWFAEREDDQ